MRLKVAAAGYSAILSLVAYNGFFVVQCSSWLRHSFNGCALPLFFPSQKKSRKWQKRASLIPHLLWNLLRLCWNSEENFSVELFPGCVLFATKTNSLLSVGMCVCVCVCVCELLEEALGCSGFCERYPSGFPCSLTACGSFTLQWAAALLVLRTQCRYPCHIPAGRNLG